MVLIQMVLIQDVYCPSSRLLPVADLDAPCSQGGNLFVAGLGAEGIAAQAYLIAFPKSSVDN